MESHHVDVALHRIKMEYIVTYTSSEEKETDQDAERTRTSHCDTPRSSSATTCKASAARTSSPESHQGRIRSFPHVEGQFATHVYFEVTGGQDNKNLTRLIQAFESSSTADGEAFHPIQQPFHVSLSRTVAITSTQMRSLLSELKHSLHKTFASFRKRPRKSIFESSLHVRIGEAACILVNDENTRTFLSLSVSMQGNASLESVIDHVSRVFKRHGLKEYYENPNIHTSVGWCLGNQEMQMQKILDAQKNLRYLAWSSSVSRILCRIGKKEHIVWSSACP